MLAKDWVEKKIRRHMARARNRNGPGWKRWVRNGFANLCGCSTATRFGRLCRNLLRHDSPHNPEESAVWEIRTLRSTWPVPIRNTHQRHGIRESLWRLRKGARN
jgi:hypothetical protein